MWTSVRRQVQSLESQDDEWCWNSSFALGRARQENVLALVQWCPMLAWASGSMWALKLIHGWWWGVKNLWFNFHRLQTLAEQACGDRCKALKARMRAWRGADETRPPMDDLSTQLPSTSPHQSKNMFLSSPLQNCYSTAHFEWFLFSHLCRVLLVSHGASTFS